EFAEILYFFKFKIGTKVHAFALVILFSSPDFDLLKDSEYVVWSAVHMGVNGLRVVDVSCIQAVVSMPPH
ncbi:hypothetical protein DFH09DRAFT_895457, partial [Mycena vulgaris]